MQDENVPTWDELSDEEKQIVDSLTSVAKLMEGISPDRVVLYFAYLVEMIIGTLSARVLSAREMQAPELLDSRLNLAGMLLSSCMNEIREAYDTMFDPTALDEINTVVDRQFTLIETMSQINDVSPEQLIAFIKGLEGAVDLDPDA